MVRKADKVDLVRLIGFYGERGRLAAREAKREGRSKMDTVYILTETDTCTFLIHGVYSNDIAAKDAFSMVLTARIRDAEKDKDAFRDKTGSSYLREL